MSEALVKYIFSRAHLSNDKECVLWEGAQVKGHGMLTGGAYVHRVVYVHFKGAIPAGLEIGHTCDVKRCVRPEHLEAVTRQKNVQDALRRHLFQRAKYNDEDLKALRSKEISLKTFAMQFDITIKTAYNIRNGHKVKWR